MMKMMMGKGGGDMNPMEMMGAMMGGGMGKGGEGGGQKFRDGDWKCPSCGDHQFARNDKCRKCETPKPENLDAPPCKWCQKGECWDHGQIAKPERSAPY